MSVAHVALVLDHLKVKPAQKLVAVILADHADLDGVCWPSYRRIAERSGLDERTVRRHVRFLIDLGVVTKLRTGTVTRVGERAVHMSNAYRIEADVIRRLPLLSAAKLSTDGLGTNDEFVHLEVVKNTHPRGGRLSTKSSTNHHTNRQSQSLVENAEALSVGDVLGSILKHGTLG